MNTNSLKELLPDVERIVLPFLEREGVELVETNITGVGRSLILRLVVWEKGGIGLDRLSKLSRHISDLLDCSSIIDKKYTLEVSSPGLDRILKTSADFRRAQGEKIKVILKDSSEISGLLISAIDDEIVVGDDENRKKLNLSEIAKGQIIIEF